MNRRIAWAIVAGAGVLVVASVVILGGGDDGTQAEDAAETSTEATDPDDLVEILEEATDEEIETVEALLYFPGAGSKLYAEAREVAASADARELSVTLVRELMAGPTEDLLTPILGPDITVSSVLISPEGVAFVDLRSDEHTTPPVTGSTQEALTLYSLVQTLVENVAAIEAVVILWNGRQPQTFGGHIDTTHPLVPDPVLVVS